MGSGGCEDECCTVKKPLNRAEFILASILLLLSFIWFVCCLDGLNKMPKCRYGTNDCYFVRQQTSFDGKITQQAFKNRAIEGDSDESLEQLAIPFLVTFLSLLPPVLIFFATLCGKDATKTIEIGKFFLTGCAITMLFSVRICDQLTFDCRWWNNENQDKCKTSFNTFAAGAFFTILTQICLLVVAVFQSQKDADCKYSEHSEPSFSDRALAGDASGGGSSAPYKDNPAEEPRRDVTVDMQ
jgi:hypothetical protein